MAQQGAALQSQNNELVQCIEALREKRELINKQIRDETTEKEKIQSDLQVRRQPAAHARPPCCARGLRMLMDRAACRR